MIQHIRHLKLIYVFFLISEQFQLLAPPKQNPYKVLGINPGASEVEIKKARDNLAKKYHSDKTGSANDAKMQELNAAFDQIKSGSTQNTKNDSEQDLFAEERDFQLKKFKADILDIDSTLDSQTITNLMFAVYTESDKEGWDPTFVALQNKEIFDSASNKMLLFFNNPKNEEIINDNIDQLIIYWKSRRITTLTPDQIKELCQDLESNRPKVIELLRKLKDHDQLKSIIEAYLKYRKERSFATQAELGQAKTNHKTYTCYVRKDVNQMNRTEILCLSPLCFVIGIVLSFISFTLQDKFFDDELITNKLMVKKFKKRRAMLRKIFATGGLLSIFAGLGCIFGAYHYYPKDLDGKNFA